jgi:hypothetical protein
MPGYYRILPEYIATHTSLTAEEKLFYSLLHSLISKFGFCWASNQYLAELTHTCVRTVQRYIKKLAKHNLIIIELECYNERKIWTPETWGNRANLLKAYGEEIINSSEKFNQRFYTHDNRDMGGMTAVSPYKKETTKKEKHREAWPKPQKPKSSLAAKPSEHSSNGQDKRQLPPSMHGSPPTPGPKKMVEDTTEILKQAMKIGSKHFLIHPHDFAFFFGFSPSVLSEAIYRTNMASLNGKRIANIVAYIFERCCDVRREQNE